MKGNKGEWSEIYTLLKLLGDGELFGADENMEKIEEICFPILKILREEQEYSNKYLVNGLIRVVDSETDELVCTLERSRFLETARLVFQNILSQRGRSISLEKFHDAEEISAFFEKIRLQSIKAKSSDKSDLTIQLHDARTGTSPILGFSVKSMLGKQSTLFNPGRTTNFIFTVEGSLKEDFSYTDVNVSSYNSGRKIGERFDKVEDAGGKWCFERVESEMLNLNLRLIDGDLPEILANMLKIGYQKKISKLSELIDELQLANPLDYNLSEGHPFYRYKVVKFLYDVALGMTPQKAWLGDIQANGGVIVVKRDGEVLAYHTYYKSKFEDYLLENTRLEQPSTGEDESSPGEKDPSASKKFYFGWIYPNNDGKLSLKVNLQIRFTK